MGGLNTYGYAGGDPVNFSDPFGLCSEKDGWSNCSLGHLLQFKVSFGGQAAYSLDAGPVSSSLKFQVWKVGTITVNKNGADLKMSNAELSAESGFTAWGVGGNIKADVLAPTGEGVSVSGVTDLPGGGQIGSSHTQKSRSIGTVKLKVGVGILFGAEVNTDVAKALYRDWRDQKP